MSIPGMNLLKMAQTVIARQVVIYYKVNGRATNDAGFDVSGFDPGTNILVSVQAVPDAVLRQMGIDTTKKHLMIYDAENTIIALQRGSGGDQFGFNTRRYQALDTNDWRAIDGWNGAMLVDIGKDKGDA